MTTGLTICFYVFIGVLVVWLARLFSMVIVRWLFLPISSKEWADKGWPDD